MNILILTGKFGMGHWSASQSLRLQLLNAFPAANVTVEDFFAYALPDASEAIYKGFSLLVTHGSGLYNIYYKATENASLKTRPPLESLFQDKLAELLWERRPDAVIATHPFCAQLVSDYKEELCSTLPLVTCITDLTSHSEWINDHTDCYLVGSPEIRDRLEEKGVDHGRILVTGIPVKPEFKAPARRGQDGVRRLLIMGGGLGLLPKRDSFYEALNALPDVRTTLITGGNQKLYDKLHGKYENIEVVGFTDRSMPFSASLRRISRGERFWSARYFALCRAKFSSFIKPSRCISATAAAAERASNFRHSLSYSSPDAWSRKERYPRALSLALRVSLCSFRASRDAASSAAPSLTWFFNMVSTSLENRKCRF